MDSSLKLGLEKVLLVDDHDGVRALGVLLFKAMGVDVEVVKNGQEALKRALQGTFDAVLMDVHMPELDGLDATIEMRKEGYSKPIFLMSTDSRQEVQETARENGANGFVSKPLTLSRVTQILEGLHELKKANSVWH